MGWPWKPSCVTLVHVFVLILIWFYRGYLGKFPIHFDMACQTDPTVLATLTTSAPRPLVCCALAALPWRRGKRARLEEISRRVRIECRLFFPDSRVQIFERYPDIRVWLSFRAVLPLAAKGSGGRGAWFCLIQSGQRWCCRCSSRPSHEVVILAFFWAMEGKVSEPIPFWGRHLRRALDAVLGFSFTLQLRHVRGCQSRSPGRGRGAWQSLHRLGRHSWDDYGCTSDGQW